LTPTPAVTIAIPVVCRSRSEERQIFTKHSSIAALETNSQGARQEAFDGYRREISKFTGAHTTTDIPQKPESTFAESAS